ncbi:MAG: CDP-glycerol glycerophosphotransferase family protein [Magnetospirillum sp.]|nr:CDP-glycerol glycerophosphotransferase family protein [Magnetospirillum sp.]
MTKAKLKVLVVIDHDIMIRHFVRSGALARLSAVHDATFVFPELGNKRIRTNIDELGLPKVRHLQTNSLRYRLWSWLAHVNRLRWRPGKHWASLRKLTKGHVGGHFRHFTLLSLPGIFQLYRWRTLRQLAAIPCLDMRRLLDEERPDVIVHPTVLEGVFLNDLMIEARKRSIPFIAVMNSWDNPSAKQMAYHKPDWLLVWGEQTKRHAMTFLQMREDRVIKFGVAQFDVYRDPPRLDQAEFFRRNGIPTGKKVLLYAGSAKDTDEFKHLCRLDDAVESGQLGNVTVLYRPHPWGHCGKRGERVFSHPWRHVRFESNMIKYVEDVHMGHSPVVMSNYEDTRDVLSHVDALISPLSTIIVEAALMGVPAMCFLPKEETEAGFFQTVFDNEHFQDIYKSPEFILAVGEEELLPKTTALLERACDPAIAARMKDASRFFVEWPDGLWSDRIVSFVENVAG